MDKTKEEYWRNYNRAYAKSLREERKRLGICVRCGKEAAFKPRLICPLCMEHVAAYNAKRLMENNDDMRIRKRAYERQYRKNIRRLRKEQGICINCGKRKPATGKVMCEICLEKYREYRIRSK